MSRTQGARALLLSVLLLFTLAAGMGWYVGRGLSRGQTALPMKQSSLRRSVSRAEEPGMYWFSMSIYSAIAAGALGLGVAGLIAWRRLPR